MAALTATGSTTPTLRTVHWMNKLRNGRLHAGKAAHILMITNTKANPDAGRLRRRCKNIY